MPYFYPLITSGAIVTLVPIPRSFLIKFSDYTLLAAPKSAILYLPLLIKMFSDLKSL